MGSTARLAAHRASIEVTADHAVDAASRAVARAEEVVLLLHRPGEARMPVGLLPARTSAAAGVSAEAVSVALFGPGRPPMLLPLAGTSGAVVPERSCAPC